MRGHVEMLAEARRAAWQQVEAQAAAQKATELAANRAVWQAIDAAKPAEEKARAALKLAIDLLSAGREEPARRRLQDVIDKFPGTGAAAQAEELLK
jgi:TolA-binding protein